MIEKSKDLSKRMKAGVEPHLTLSEKTVRKLLENEKDAILDKV